MDKQARYSGEKMKQEPIAELAVLSRAVAAEGMVLLQNERNTLPLSAGDRISVFGRVQREYYKSGTGSGGKVNVPYITNILDSLREKKGILINETLAEIYANWCAEHPNDVGHGWGTEPWSQVEMPIDMATVRAAREVSDKALVIIGRTAGEDKDNSVTEGSWYLTEAEETMLSNVTRGFDRVCVVLNVGNIIDMSWVKKYGVSAVLYAWQGGMEGGRATADVLCGDVNPSGKLSDTIAAIGDYPSTANFHGENEVVYEEDIYIGYRYFETFARDKVLYPFGFGLSYTTFSVGETSAVTDGDAATGTVTVSATVTNTGNRAGKETIQVYLGAPDGRLGKPRKVLTAFAKTNTLQPGEGERLTASFRIADFASYDDGGVTGHKSAWVLEKGAYTVFVGTDCRSAGVVHTYEIPETVVKQCKEALSPVRAFRRLRPGADGQPTYETVPTRTYDTRARRDAARPAATPETGDRGLKLSDVREGRCTMGQFLAQIPTGDLSALVRGVYIKGQFGSPGNCGCIGAVTPKLAAYGIPLAAVANGPSGLRVDIEKHSTGIPNGTALACSWNPDLIESVSELVGWEMNAYFIECLLGPGVNLHRSPLCGRNFEYFSEDPYLTGICACAMTRGVRRAGVDCTVKHFAGNEQEWHRGWLNAVVSERALRELYLKPFEMTVKYGQERTVMTGYNLINGIHCASDYDLNTTVLRDEWGFDGFVMTDWWAKMNEPGGENKIEYLSLMVRAQNDVYMCVTDPVGNPDDLSAALENGSLTRGELERCATNICTFLMHSHAMNRPPETLAKPESGSTATVTSAEELHDKLGV